jgi:hypothetical protein
LQAPDRVRSAAPLPPKGLRGGLGFAFAAGATKASAVNHFLCIINNQFLFIFNGLCLAKAIFWEQELSPGDTASSTVSAALARVIRAA